MENDSERYMIMDGKLLWPKMFMDGGFSWTTNWFNVYGRRVCVGGGTLWTANVYGLVVIDGEY